MRLIQLMMMILLIDKSDSQFSLVQFSESLVWLQTELVSTPTYYYY